jgi:hypothetical protein
MKITRQRQWQFSAAFLLLSLATVPCSVAQDTAASVKLASASFASDGAEQVSLPQPGTDVTPQAGPKQLSNFIEAGGDYLALSNNFGY